MSFHDVLTLIAFIVTFILGVGFNEVYHLRKGTKEDKVLEVEKATYQDLARTLADANRVLTNQISILEQFLESQQKRINELVDDICDKLREIEALKSKNETYIPTLDRQNVIATATLKDGREVVNIPDTGKWVDKAMKYSYPGKWSERLTFTLICKLLEKNGFIEYPSGGLGNPISGHCISFVGISQYNSVEAFQKDWPYK